MTAVAKPLLVRVPRNAEQLQSLGHEDIEQLAIRGQLQLSHLHHNRAKLLKAEPHDTSALATVGAQIKAAGNLLGAVLARRGQLRQQRRRALGQMPRRNDAIAMAVDSRLSGKAWQRVQEEADRILATAAKDLEQEAAPTAPEADQSNQQTPPVNP
jgi:hypothetical protein